MPTEQGKQSSQQLPTEGIPSIYVNHASVSISYNDIRIYLSEVTPKVIASESSPGIPVEPLVNPKISVVFNPEFARAVAAALSAAVAEYERRFGTLRPDPQMV